MSDLIDRQRALDAFDYWVKSPMVGYSNGLLRLHEMLEEIPPAKPEPCDDAISRDKAIVQLNHLLSDWDDDWNVAIRKCIETVKGVQPIIPAEKVGQWIDAEVLDKIRAEIIKYEGDCRLSVDEYPSCKQCTDNTFETIYAILDKYKAESEGGTQHERP